MSSAKIASEGREFDLPNALGKPSGEKITVRHVFSNEFRTAKSVYLPKLRAALADEKDVTIFFSTHILSDIESISDQVAILNHGQLIAEGKLEELKKEHGEEKMDDLYLKLVREAE